MFPCIHLVKRLKTVFSKQRQNWRWLGKRLSVTLRFINLIGASSAKLHYCHGRNLWMRHLHRVLVEPSCYVMLISLAVADVYILLSYFFSHCVFFTSLIKKAFEPNPWKIPTNWQHSLLEWYSWFVWSRFQRLKFGIPAKFRTLNLYISTLRKHKRKHKKIRTAEHCLVSE